MAVLRRRRHHVVGELRESRGLGEEICKEFRLGLSPAGGTLAHRLSERHDIAQHAAAKPEPYALPC